MICRARAPLRIDLAGGWTDVAAYAARAGGAVVNVAITLYAHAWVRSEGQGVRLRALDLGALVDARRPEELRAGGELALLKAMARRFPPGGGFELATRSDAPPGSGLGGSGALGVALAAALGAARGERRLPAEIAGLAHEVELHDAGVLGGKQDQYAAALGGLQFLAFGDPEVSLARLDVPAACLRELELHLVLCYTGASRVSGETHRRVWERYAAGDAEIVRALDGLRGCALAMREALERGDVGRVAEVLNENWRYQRALGAELETERMRELERVAFAAGADGVKACGAGAGGCLVFLAKPGREFDVAEALRGAGGQVLRFTFDTTGVVTWVETER